MKKLLALVMVAAVALPLMAQEEVKKDDARAAREEAGRDYGLWPSFFAIGNYNTTPDVIGLRLTIPYSTRHENVTGFDLGFFGRSLYFEGIQVNILRNDVKDDMCGIQVGLYNSISGGDRFALQCGLWNEADSVSGAQIGLVNTCGDAEGFQVGIINRAESLTGYQLGVINVIRSAEVQFCPVLNIGF